MAYGFKIEYLKDDSIDCPNERCEIGVLTQIENDEINVLDVVLASRNLLIMADTTALDEGHYTAHGKIRDLTCNLEELAKYLQDAHGCEKLIKHKVVAKG